MTTQLTAEQRRAAGFLLGNFARPILIRRNVTGTTMHFIPLRVYLHAEVLRVEGLATYAEPGSDWDWFPADFATERYTLGPSPEGQS